MGRRGRRGRTRAGKNEREDMDEGGKKRKEMVSKGGKRRKRRLHISLYVLTVCCEMFLMEVKEG